MKNKYINYLILIIIATFSYGCKGTTVDPTEPTTLELQLEALINNNVSWAVSGGSVVKDGYNVSSQFEGFSLSFGEFTYSTQNGLATAWPSAGIWEFVNDNPNKIIRNDGVEIDVSLINNDLVLSFNVTGVTGGRIKGIDGNYIFTLSSN